MTRHCGPMTDLLSETSSVPARLGVRAEFRDGEFRLRLDPRPELLHHGALRASVVAFMIDVVAGIVLDDDPDAWMLTSDMSVRMQPVASPASLSTRLTILRRGRRSATATVDLVTGDGCDSGDGRDRLRPAAAPSGRSREAPVFRHAHHDHVRRFQNPDTAPPGGSGHRRAGLGGGRPRDAGHARVAQSCGNPAGRHGGPPGGGGRGGHGVDPIRPHRRRDRARSPVPGANGRRPRPVEMPAARRRSRRPD